MAKGKRGGMHEGPQTPPSYTKFADLPKFTIEVGSSSYEFPKPKDLAVFGEALAKQFPPKSKERAACRKSFRQLVDRTTKAEKALKVASTEAAKEHNVRDAEKAYSNLNTALTELHEAALIANEIEEKYLKKPEMLG